MCHGNFKHFLPDYSPICRLQLIPHCLVGETDHTKFLPDFFPQAQPIKQADQGIKCTLEPVGVQQCNHAIISVEEGSLVPNLLPTLALILRSLYHHRHPVSHHRIHHHIKSGGGERISLCFSALSPKRRPVVSACLCYHCQLPPICLEEPTVPGDHAVTFQYIRTPGPVQVVISLVQVQEDHLQDLLLQGR